MQLNCENLAIHLDFGPIKDLNLSEENWQKQTYSLSPNKPLDKTQALAEAILDVDPDILALSEVMGDDSLVNFNFLFLQEKYETFYCDTNSTRGIDLAFLIKKNLPFDCKLINHKKRNIILPGGKVKKFSRGISELALYPKNSLIPCLNIFSVHLKSQISQANDFFGQSTREAEVFSLVKFYKKRIKSNPQTPMVILGDFNGIAGKNQTASEFSSIYSTDLEDIHDLKNSKLEDRASHVLITPNGPKFQQLDYIFVNENLKSQIDFNNTYSYRYKFFGCPWPLAETLKEKQSLPSDHYPQVITFNLKNSSK